MSSTLRQWRGAFFTYLVVWAGLTILAALTGPFGTYDLLPSLARFAYWAAVVAVSILLNLALVRAVRGRGDLVRLLARLPYAVVLGALIYLLNRVIFSAWGGWADYAWLVFVVTAIGLFVEGAMLLLARRQAAEPVADTADPTEAFLRRIPLDKRGALIRLEAQDHYLNVVTTAGAALILLRMADAESELDGAHGLRVHRSHWVAIDRVLGHRRRDGRDFLITADEGEVPVSRSFRAAVKAAGLIAG